MDGTEVIIIGAGPAGVAAAIQLQRQGIDACLLEQDTVGGLMRNAEWIENYPGFPRGITGMELASLFRDQLRIRQIPVYREKVVSVEETAGGFRITSTRCSRHSGIVILATGTRPRPLPELHIPPGLEHYVADTIVPVMNGQNARIAIIGAGDAAFDYALNLAKANDVVILNRGSRRRCLPLLWERSLKNPRIQYLADTTVQELKPGNRPGVFLECISGSEKVRYSVDFLITATGRQPEDRCLSEKLRLTLKDHEKSGKLFRIGDVKGGIFRQVAIAAGEGIKAAMTIYQGRINGNESNCFRGK